MGHIIKTEEDYNYLCTLVNEINENSFDKGTVESVLRRLLPKDCEGDFLIDYNIRDRGGYTAIFIPKYEIINISLLELYAWVDRNAADLATMYEVEDTRLLSSYLCLLAIMHELEHAYQYLVGIGKVEAPCKMIKEGYKTLFDLMIRKDYVIPRPIKQARRAISLVAYKSKENEFLLESNAQFDSLGTLSNIAFDNGHHEIRGALMDMRTVFATAGYTKNGDGPLINTFKSILMGDKLKKIDHDYECIDMMDRYRLGLPVDQRTRERILALRK